MALVNLYIWHRLIPNPPIYITNKINNLIFDFMWNGKGDKIKRNVMINLHDKGGLNIPHFQTVCIAHKNNMGEKIHTCGFGEFTVG